MSVASRTFLLAAFLAVGLLSACDLAEQNYDYTPGNSLDIVGPAAIELEVEDGDYVPVTGEYYVRAFTIDKNYTWTVNGQAPDSTWRQGEYIAVVYDTPGTYTIEVDDGVEYSGTLEVVVAEAEEEEATE